jgi:hypothetical protein
MQMLTSITISLVLMNMLLFNLANNNATKVNSIALFASSALKEVSCKLCK